MPGVRILPDLPNNSIVIYANAEQYRIIERALNQLDRPQAQVAVEMTIAEVTLNNTLQLWRAVLFGQPQYFEFVFQWRPGDQLADGQRGAVRTQPGFNFMIGSKLTPHVIISALNQYTTTKILSNPSLVVLDNQVATL